MIVLSPNKILFCTPQVWYTSGQGPLFPLSNTGCIYEAVLNGFYTLIVVCPKLKTEYCMHNRVYLVYEICLYFIKNNDCNMNFCDMQFTNCRLAKSHDFTTCVSFSQVGN